MKKKEILLNKIPGSIEKFEELLKKQIGSSSLHISPLFGSSKAFAVKAALNRRDQVVVLFPDIKQADEFFVEMNVIGFDKELIVINEFRPEILQEKLTAITSREKFILISSYNLLNCLFPSREDLTNKTVKIEAGSDISYDDLIEYLSLFNYQSDRFVEAPGEYSKRGALIDFWSYSERMPVRAEFDGDFLESLRYFDPENQRSTDKTDHALLAASLNTTSQSGTDIFGYLKNPCIFVSSYELGNFQLSEINYFKETTSVATQIQTDDLSEDDFPEKANDTEEPKLQSSEHDLTSLLNKNTDGIWIIEEELSGQNTRTELGLTEAPVINGNYEVLQTTLNNFCQSKYEVVITAENELQADRLKELLGELSPEIENNIESGSIKIDTLPIKSGFVDKNSSLLVLTDYQIFNKPYRSRIPLGRKFKKSKSKAFASIKRGDFVVHEDYGIGKYAGLETIQIGDVSQESMKLLYNEGGVVYVNLNYLALVKKYSSGENITPSLSTLGTADWSNTKTKTKKKIKEAARELIELYAKRKAAAGYAFESDTIWQKELEASFMYEDTPDQARVTTEVKTDMEAANPMDRLVCGDVGFGKTEVAVRAAFKAAQEGKQTAVLVPTTILAEQHYNTFKDRLTQFPVKVAALSRFQSKKEQNEIVKQLKEGTIDIIIGTHRLLSKDVEFKELGLLIIDEEHRFGVTAKEKLRSLKINVDTLTLTATPIPRTLNLSLLGARDLSIIATPPPNRQPIYTSVSTFDIVKIREWILTELRRNGQVYFVHDRVQSIEKLAGYLNKYIPEIKIGIAHGQMKPAMLEEVIHGFLNKKYDVLLSTKIIESGIDIPNVNTIIVNRADRFGLAELHQLRGRVGRSNRQAYAYFIVPSLAGITKKALRRLQAIEEFTDIGSGFNLSMRDLEIRGAGNLLGKEQTGFINEVGFDLYVKLINEAVEELKYQEYKEIFKSLPKPAERTEPTIDAYFELGIPKSYMPEQSERLSFYTAMYSLQSIDELNDLVEEMKDRYGPLPDMVKKLIGVASLKYYASLALFERVIIQRKNIFMILPRSAKEDYYHEKFPALMKFVVNEHSKEIKFNQQKDVMRLIIENRFDSEEKILDFLVKICRDVIKLFENSDRQEEVAN